MKKICTLMITLVCLVMSVRAEEAQEQKDFAQWRIYNGDGFYLVVPSGWRELPFLSRTQKLYLNGDGIGVPTVDETGSPIQIGLVVESYPKTKESLDEISKGLAEAPTGDPRLQLVGKHAIQRVKLADGTEAHLLVVEFIKEKHRRSLQMKLIAKDNQSTAWIVSGFLVGGKDSKLPTRNSALANRLKAHMLSLCFDKTKLDLTPFPALYGTTNGETKANKPWQPTPEGAADR